MAGGGGARLLAADFALSFMWVCSGVLYKMVAHTLLGFGHDATGEAVACSLSIANMFLFAYLTEVTHGAYNPLTLIPNAISGGFPGFLFVLLARIPAQTAGSIAGVKFLIATIPEIGQGPRLAVEVHHGALTEGFLTFAIIVISLALSRNIPGSFYRKTWISSVCKLSLHILGSDLTGGCMNPASAMGWAYARGNHWTKEHVFVYWLAPVEATLLAVWIFKLLPRPMEKEKGRTKAKKSD
ncbi:hypothetical protein NMG60_11008938 [Bertholletia excelsa]